MNRDETSGGTVRCVALKPKASAVTSVMMIFLDARYPTDRSTTLEGYSCRSNSRKQLLIGLEDGDKQIYVIIRNERQWLTMHLARAIACSCGAFDMVFPIGEAG